MQLSAGQNAPLDATTAVVRSSSSADLVALVLSEDGRVASDADMVFFNQPTAPGVRLDGATLTVALGELRPGADRVVLVGSVDAPGQPLGEVTVTAGAAHSFAPTGLTTETAVVLVELYQRGGAWKVRAVGQGYDDGLAGLARDFGVSVDDEPAAPPPAPRVSFTKGEDRLPVDLRKALNLRKEKVAVVLEKHAALGLPARVVLVLDVSGSTNKLYKQGVFARSVERVVPVAAQLDDDGEMQVFAMGSSTARMDDLTVGELPGWLAANVAALPRVTQGAGNNEKAAIDTVCRFVRDQRDETPTLVLFFHDGGVTDDRGTEKAIRDAVEAPVFWQFIGIGKARFGILERLDDLTGRRVDNTGFFSLRDIDAVSDDELYDRILHEFPSWVRAYYPADHPARRAVG